MLAVETNLPGGLLTGEVLERVLEPECFRGKVRVVILSRGEGNQEGAPPEQWRERRAAARSPEGFSPEYRTEEGNQGGPRRGAGW